VTEMNHHDQLWEQDHVDQVGTHCPGTDKSSKGTKACETNWKG
jgi:hypothetical protein